MEEESVSETPSDIEQAKMPVARDATTQDTLRSAGSISSQEAVDLSFDETMDLSGYHGETYTNYKREGGYSLYFRLEILYWLICMLVGIIIGLLVFAVDIISRTFGHFKYALMSRIVQDCNNDITSCFQVMLFITLGINIVATMISAIIAAFEGARTYSGSGLTLTATYLNGIFLPRALCVRTGFAMAIGIMFSLLGGMPTGREAPMVYLSAILMTSIASGAFFSRLSDKNFLWHFGAVDRDQKDLVSIGAAAGFAATLGTPFGGVIYVLEEGASFWKQSLAAKATMTAFLAFFVASQLTQLTYLAPYNHDIFGSLLEPGLGMDLGIALLDVPVAILMGTLGGALGALFNCMTMQLRKFRTGYVASIKKKLVESFVIALGVTGIMFANILTSSVCAEDKRVSRNLFDRRDSFQAVFNHNPVRVLLGPKLPILGMAAFSSGVLRRPVALTIMIAELINNFYFVPILLLTTISAMMIGNLF
ncbi:unnamed protein product, partial [Notodromas monacha]